MLSAGSHFCLWLLTVVGVAVAEPRPPPQVDRFAREMVQRVRFSIAPPTSAANAVLHARTQFTTELADTPAHDTHEVFAHLWTLQARLHRLRLMRKVLHLLPRVNSTVIPVHHQTTATSAPSVSTPRVPRTAPVDEADAVAIAHLLKTIADGTEDVSSMIRVPGLHAYEKANRWTKDERQWLTKRLEVDAYKAARAIAAAEVAHRTSIGRGRSDPARSTGQQEIRLDSQPTTTSSEDAPSALGPVPLVGHVVTSAMPGHEPSSSLPLISRIPVSYLPTVHAPTTTGVPTNRTLVQMPWTPIPTGFSTRAPFQSTELPSRTPTLHQSEISMTPVPVAAWKGIASSAQSKTPSRSSSLDPTDSTSTVTRDPTMFYPRVTGGPLGVLPGHDRVVAVGPADRHSTKTEVADGTLRFADGSTSAPDSAVGDKQHLLLKIEHVLVQALRRITKCPFEVDRVLAYSKQQSIAAVVVWRMTVRLRGSTDPLTATLVETSGRNLFPRFQLRRLVSPLPSCRASITSDARTKSTPQPTAWITQDAYAVARGTETQDLSMSGRLSAH